ncbi:MAG: hypoxanthine phosphoribosyltransferase [Geminicoccaceae bacterium]|mgnify:CR=1 FL=1
MAELPAEAVTALFDEATLARRVEELAQDIAQRLPPRFTVVGLLKGSFVFVADLVRALQRAGAAPRIEFMRVSSYGHDTKSSGIVSLMGDAPPGVQGETVLLVDDIQDTGRTLAFTRGLLLERGARKVWTCTLLDKPSRREVEGGEVDFVGFTIPDLFVVGYGIDYAERYRYLPFIGSIRS